MDRDKLNTIANGLLDASDDILRGNTVKLAYIKELSRLTLSALGSEAKELYSANATLSEEAESALSEAKRIAPAGVQGADLALALHELFRLRYGEPDYSDIFAAEGDIKARTAFVSGGGADAALEMFRRRFKLTPMPVERISAACDVVLDGDADYCILPLKNSRDGRLRSFYRMIDVYDLKITAVGTVGTDENVTKYALCGRSVAPLFRSPGFIELSAPANGNEALLITEAARETGLAISEISFTPSERDGEIYSFVFRAGDDFRPFILYMNVYHPHYTLMGMYNTINE